MPLATSARRRAASLAAVCAATSVLITGHAGATTPYHFNQPAALARVGTNIWVANAGGNSLTEVSSSGAFIRTVTASKYRLVTPQALSAFGTTLFVASAAGIITELNGVTAALTRTMSALSYRLADPVAITSSWPDLYVVNKNNSTVTIITMSTGHLVSVIANSHTHPTALAHPNAIAVAGADIWVTNSTSNSVSEFNKATGAFVRTLTSHAYQFSSPGGISFDGTRLWVTDVATNAVTEFAAANGALVQVITNSSLNGGYGFDGPSTTLASGQYVYVISPPGSSPMVTQMAKSTGDAKWMMCNTNYAFEFQNPSALAMNGADLWVTSQGNNGVIEMVAETGALVTRLS
jgi:hypothetical protein